MDDKNGAARGSAYGSRKNSTAHRANTPTPGEYMPSNSPNEENDQFSERVYDVFKEFDHENKNSIPAGAILQLLYRLERERVIRLKSDAMQGLEAMFISTADITVSYETVLELIPQLQSDQPNLSVLGSLCGSDTSVGAESSSRIPRSVPASPLSVRKRSTPISEHRSSQLSGMGVWRRRAEGNDYDTYDGYNEEGRRTTDPRDVARSPTEEPISPLLARQLRVSRQSSSASPSLPTSPNAQNNSNRRLRLSAEFADKFERNVEYYASVATGAQDNALVEDFRRLLQEYKDQYHRHQNNEERTSEGLRKNEEMLATADQRINSLKADLHNKKSIADKLKVKEQEYIDQIRMLEGEIQKHAKVLETLRANFKSLKGQYEEKCADEEKLFEKLKARDEELFQSGQNLARLNAEQKRSTEIHQEMEQAIINLESGVKFAQQMELQNVELRAINASLMKTNQKLREDFEERNNTNQSQVPDSLGRATLAVVKAAGSARTLQTEMADSSFDNENAILADISNAGDDASFAERRARMIELGIGKTHKGVDNLAALAGDLRTNKDIHRYIHILENQARCLSQEQEQTNVESMSKQEELREQVKHARNDNANLKMQLQILRSRNKSAPETRTCGVQCESGNNYAEQRWRSAHSDSESAVQRRPQTPRKSDGHYDAIDSMLVEPSELRVSELGVSTQQRPEEFQHVPYHLVTVQRVALVLLSVYLFGVLSASWFFDPTGGKLGAFSRSSLFADPNVGEAVWTVHEPTMVVRPRWLELLIYNLEDFVYGEGMSALPT